MSEDYWFGTLKQDADGWLITAERGPRVSDDLVEWLRAQLDEDERKARTLGDWPVSAIATELCESATIMQLDMAFGYRALADHVTNWDPSRVLREVEAKRKILDFYATEVRVESEHDGWTPGVNKLWGGGRRSALHHAVQLLAEVYSDRPGYREQGRPA